MRETDNSVFFWSGMYSQWFESPFEAEGQKFNCTEQYMMYKKAMLFGDEGVANAIMKTRNPSDQKALGRQVRNFNSEVWNQHAIDIVSEGNYQKFKQNPNLSEILLGKHLNKEIVEASPKDKIWGIGLHYSDEACDDKSKWQGTNWLGISIMNARERLVEEYEEHKKGLKK
jgi:ribA/ribD-fused uncharacterized protein